MEFLRSPMRRHLPAPAGGIVLRSHGRQQHIVSRRAHLQAERPVAIVRVEPVVARLEVKRRRHADALVPYSVDLEESLILALELNLFVVHAARHVHRPIRSEEQLPRKRGSFQDMIHRRGHGPSPEVIFLKKFPYAKCISALPITNYQIMKGQSQSPGCSQI